jgi:sugar/nucleoside kinase (ribokinase family)
MTPTRFDAVGIGLNSVDLLCLVDRYPEFNTKGALREISKQGGGQAATAMVALARLGLKVAYIGSVGDDEEGRFSLESLRHEGVNVDGVAVQLGRASQFAVITVQREGNEEDQGGRTIMWRREVELRPEELREDIVKAGRILHIDGHSVDAEIKAVRWAREAGIPVSFDAERVMPGTEELVSMTDYLVASEDFPAVFTATSDPKEALWKIQASGPRVAAMTKGPRGALAFDGERFYESPGFRVNALDTTGAGDVFHAALSCRKLGGRAGICGWEEVENFIAANTNP